MKTGDHIESLALVEAAFRSDPHVHRIMIERQGEGLFHVTQMDGLRPNDLRHSAKAAGLQYECRHARGYEQAHGYHLPSDTVKYVFYRLDNEKDAA